MAFMNFDDGGACGAGRDGLAEGARLKWEPRMCVWCGRFPATVWSENDTGGSDGGPRYCGRDDFVAGCATPCGADCCGMYEWIDHGTEADGDMIVALWRMSGREPQEETRR